MAAGLEEGVFAWAASGAGVDCAGLAADCACDPGEGEGHTIQINAPVSTPADAKNNLVNERDMCGSETSRNAKGTKGNLRALRAFAFQLS
jgi:hypothetical protein